MSGGDRGAITDGAAVSDYAASGAGVENRMAPWLLATNHPSAILRVPDPELRRQSREQFFSDLAIVATKLREERKS